MKALNKITPAHLVMAFAIICLLSFIALASGHATALDIWHTIGGAGFALLLAELFADLF